MNKIYVIAGTSSQAFEWMRNHAMKRFDSGDTSVSLTDYVIINSEDQMRGLREVHGFFVGTYRGRKDLQEIVHRIRLINNIPSGVQILPCEI
jgi:hypothetical protein